MGAEQSLCETQPKVVTKKNVVQSSRDLDQKRKRDIYNTHGNELHIAAANGDENQARALLRQGGGVNSLDGAGRTPLMMACKYGKLQTARLLIKFGANPDLKDNRNFTAKSHTTHHHVEEWLNRYLRTRKLSDEGDMQLHNYQGIKKKMEAFDRYSSASSCEGTHSNECPSRCTSAASNRTSSTAHSSTSTVSRAPSDSCSSASTASCRTSHRLVAIAGRAGREGGSCLCHARPGSTIKAGLASIRMECSKRPHERCSTDTAHKAEVVHKMNEIDVSLGPDLTTHLQSSDICVKARKAITKGKTANSNLRRY